MSYQVMEGETSSKSPARNFWSEVVEGADTSKDLHENQLESSVLFITYSRQISRFFLTGTNSLANTELKDNLKRKLLLLRQNFLREQFVQLQDESINPFEKCEAHSQELPKSNKEEIFVEVRRIFASARYETFEDGKESELSRQLEMLLEKFGSDLIVVLADNRILKEVSSNVLAETLKVLGFSNHITSFDSRLWILERFLNSSKAEVKDAAALGLSYMNDSRALPYLRAAIFREKNKELREDLQSVLDQLSGV